MISLNDVLLAMSNIPVDDPIAEIWGRGLQGGYRIIEYTGSLPITISANGDALLDYRIYVADSGIGEPTENLFDESTVESGWHINTINGNFVADIEYKTSYYIAVNKTNHALSAKIKSFFGGWALDVNFYDNNKNWIGGKHLMQTDVPVSTRKVITFSIPSNASYVRVSYHRSIYDDIMLVEGSTAPTSYIPYGYKLPMVVHSELKDIGDTVYVNGDLWDIVNYNNDFTRATLLRHEVMPIMMYGAKQAIFAFPSGLAAGDYHFMVAQHPWVSTDVGKTLAFTLTQAIPEGGQLALNVVYNVTLVGATISSYASPMTTTVIETVTMTEGDSGTDLGSLTNGGTPSSNINSLQKALLGSNEWKTSALRQHLNSDKAAGSVWTPQTIYDRPPTWATNTTGFMNGLDEDFLSCVADTTYVTARNTVSDGGGTDILTDKFYLPSITEIFGTNEIINTPEGTLYQYYVNATKADRIKYLTNAYRAWWLRTPNNNYAYLIRLVSNTGELASNYAYIALSFAPACQIDLTKLSNSWLQNNMYKVRATTTPVYIGENQLDAGEYVSYGEQKIYRDVDGTLTPTDPPVPLPEIPTIDGTTVIDYDGDPKPSQMYVKYKGKGGGA